MGTATSPLLIPPLTTSDLQTPVYNRYRLTRTQSPAHWRSPACTSIRRRPSARTSASLLSLQLDQTGIFKSCRSWLIRRRPFRPSAPASALHVDPIREDDSAWTRGRSSEPSSPPPVCSVPPPEAWRSWPVPHSVSHARSPVLLPVGLHFDCQGSQDHAALSTDQLIQRRNNYSYFIRKTLMF